LGLEYLIDELPSVILDHMRSNDVDKLWDPAIEDIEHVYEHTTDNCPLQELLIICFAAKSHEKQTIILAAPEAFVRGYALHFSASRYDSTYDFRVRHARSTSGCSKMAALELGTTVTFPLCVAQIKQQFYIRA
jgi:hypothetical protein